MGEGKGSCVYGWRVWGGVTWGKGHIFIVHRKSQQPVLNQKIKKEQHSNAT